MITDARQIATSFVDQLTALHFENVFNPYTDTCPIHDQVDAPLIRCRNLQLVLEAAISGGVDSIWIARDLGYRGGRRTGLALTDDIHLSGHAQLFSTLPLARATQGFAMGERTAAVVWQALRFINHPIFLWNVFPFHPHKPGNSMSNRCHTSVERLSCQSLNLQLIKILHPQKVIAIGRDAEAAFTDLGINSIYIRHPSYGGQTEFLTGVADIYGVSLPEKRDVQQTSQPGHPEIGYELGVWGRCPHRRGVTPAPV
jgi:hypothetical protein